MEEYHDKPNAIVGKRNEKQMLLQAHSQSVKRLISLPCKHSKGKGGQNVNADSAEKQKDCGSNHFCKQGPCQFAAQ